MVIVEGDNVDQGWRWGELDEAIANLPEGPVRARQRTHFDALTLLGVFIQHGDRKPEQQRLECRGSLDLRAGDVRPARRSRQRGSLCSSSALMPRRAVSR